MSTPVHPVATPLAVSPTKQPNGSTCRLGLPTNRASGVGPCPAHGKGHLGRSYLGLLTAQACSWSIFSTLFARGQQTVDVGYTKYLIVIPYAAARACTRSINSTLLARRLPRCGLSLSLLRQLVVGFYRAMLCVRGTSHGPVSVCPSVCVCLSQVGVLLKRLNVGSHKQHHTIAQGL